MPIGFGEQEFARLGRSLAFVHGDFATRQQRCWMHKTMNVLNCLPKSVQAKAKQALHAIWQAETKAGNWRRARKAGGGDGREMMRWRRQFLRYHSARGELAAEIAALVDRLETEARARGWVGPQRYLATAPRSADAPAL